MYEPGRYLKVMNDSNSMPSTLEAGHQVSNPRLKTMTSWLIEGDGCPHILGGTGSQTAVADAYTAIAEGKATPEEAAKKAQASVHQARNR
jgi:ABC-type glycerol-3-phosphate transport system substrate-binding protein